MKKSLAGLLCLLMAVMMFTGCNHADVDMENTDPNARKTGLAIVTTLAGSKGSVNGENGVVKYDVTVAAVMVDAKGVIEACRFDSIGTDVSFDASGKIVSEVGALTSKYDMGEAYGMKAYAGSAYEWYEQADALAAYAVGKTVKELKAGSVGESGYAADVDLATTATIYLGGYVDAIVKAVENAAYIGSGKGDTLSIANIGSTSGSDALAEGDGKIGLSMDVAVVTKNGDTITGCILDSLGVDVGFNDEGLVTTKPQASYPTKNELKENYGMKAYAGSAYEWYEQAAALADFAVGKTADAFVNGAVDETGYAADADLATTATVYIGGYVAVIQKAAE